VEAPGYYAYDVAGYIEALREQGDLLADAAGRAGLDAAVPACPGWSVADLLRHTSYVHRWAAGIVAQGLTSPPDEPSEEEILRRGPEADALVRWFREGHAALVRTLEEAAPDLDCWAFLSAPSPLAFWARRQAHETAIHRADAESATGATSEYPADFAADGIDELIMGFGQRRKYRPATSGEGSMQVLATDTGDAWHLDVDQGRIQAHRGPGPGECTVSGPASGIYLFLWNRSGDTQAKLAIAGDRDFLTAGQGSVRVRWG
jgi:uncharacterized protein (TIGR03083 family)